MRKILIVVLSIITLSACTSDFDEINTNPIDKVDANPEELMPKAVQALFTGRSYEYYYDYYRRIMPWTQTLVPATGNKPNFMDDGSNMNQRRDMFYGDFGGLLTDIINQIDDMESDEQERYIYIKSIATILKAYYAWYVTDVNGSIPYTEAFQARYGGTLTPKFETQEILFDLLDKELDDVYTDIEQANEGRQIQIGDKDLFFQGNIQKWKRIANSLRLQMATRLMKRNPEKLKSIAAEVLNREEISSIEDDFSLLSRRFTEHSNFNPEDMAASKSMVDFMNMTHDPRRSMFFQKNDYSQENIDKLVVGGEMKQTTETVRYVGGPSSPDLVEAGKSRYYTAAQRRLDGKTYDTISKIQYRVWYPEYNAGTGNAIFPILTYASYSLLKAELAIRGIISGDAESFYKEGIRASIENYNEIALQAEVEEYVSISENDIDDYLNQSEVRFNSSDALEQIIIQQYLNYFKQPNEVWALIKRTGLPNTGTALKLESVTRDGGISLEMPRRVPLSTPSKTSLNYENEKAALDEMKQEPGFGKSESDIHGRIWWDN